ncbi:MAG: hypothetical protein EA346_00665, partial [Thioalkalivibrio sp.]
MLKRQSALLIVATLFIAALLLALITHGSGVVRSDPDRHVWIPSELTMPLQLQVAYDGQRILFRYRWPA